MFKIFLDWSDRIDIWIQERYKRQPKRKLRELQQDLFPNEEIYKAIDEALYNDPFQRKIPKKREKEEKEA